MNNKNNNKSRDEAVVKCFEKKFNKFFVGFNSKGGKRNGKCKK